MYINNCYVRKLYNSEEDLKNKQKKKAREMILKLKTTKKTLNNSKKKNNAEMSRFIHLECSRRCRR